MIKSLFNHDDEPQPQSPAQQKNETEESIRRELEELNFEQNKAKTEPVSEQEVRQIFSKIIELPPLAEKKFSEETTENLSAESAPAEIKNVEPPPAVDKSSVKSPLDEFFSGYEANESAAENRTPPAEKYQTAPVETENSPVFQNQNRSLSTAETLRQSGLAWSAAIGLFGSVVFMLILGWIFDTLTGASPYGIIGGIIIGAVIGFYQFFRVTSQIFKK